MTEYKNLENEFEIRERCNWVSNLEDRNPPIEETRRYKESIVNYFYQIGVPLTTPTQRADYHNYINGLNQQKINELFDRLNIYPKKMINKLFYLKHNHQFRNEYHKHQFSNEYIDCYLEYLFNLIAKSDKEQSVVIKKQEELIKNQQQQIDKLTERLLILEQKQKDTDDWIEDIEDELDDNKKDIKVTDLLDL